MISTKKITIKRKFQDFIRDTIFFLVRPNPYFISNFIFNLLGLQILRIFLYSLSYNFRKVLFYRSSSKSEHPYFDLLSKDGLLVINNFFDLDTFSRLSNSIEELLSEIDYGIYASGKDSKNMYIKSVRLYGNEDSEKAKFVYRCFSQNELLTELVKHTMKINHVREPRLVLQEVVVAPDGEDNCDYLNVLHADRYFHHPKVFFYINEQNASNGAYIYSKQTHKYNFFRLIHEYDLSVRESLKGIRSFLKLKPGNLNINGLESIRPFFLEKLNVKPETIIGKENTFVITDNRGFHARGVMQPNSRRVQVRIQYQYLETSWYAKLLIYLIQKLNPKVEKMLLNVQ